MSVEVWRAALEHVRWASRSGFQDELNLAGIGNAAPQTMLVLATNGIGVERRFAEACRMASVNVWVSLHRPEHAQEAVEGYKSAGVLRGISVDGAVASMNWAGQVDWPVTAPTASS